MNKVLRLMPVITLALGLIMVGCSPSTTPTPTPSTYQLEVNLLGDKGKFPVDSQGMLKSKAEVSSADGKISLSLDKGTKVLDKDGKPLRSIHTVIDPSPPLPPEDTYIIGATYNLEPQGATFDPWLTLMLGYDPEQLPEGIRENNLQETL